MKKLKFRAWCEVDTNKETTAEKMIFFNSCELDNGLWFEPEKHIVHINEWLSKPMQFTGLKDINDAEIYEGDIIKTIGKKWGGIGDDGRNKYEKVVHYSVVEWWESYSNIGYRIRSTKGKTMMIKPSSFNTMKAEVMGNIYQNPELIKK